jgi:hypothetical protein
VNPPRCRAECGKQDVNALNFSYAPKIYNAQWTMIYNAGQPRSPWECRVIPTNQYGRSLGNRPPDIPRFFFRRRMPRYASQDPGHLAQRDIQPLLSPTDLQSPFAEFPARRDKNARATPEANPRQPERDDC